MPKLVIAIIVSLLTGFAAAAWFVAAPQPKERPAGPAYLEFDAGADVEQRLQALEAAVNAERQARQLLEDEILVLYEALDALESTEQADNASLAGTELRELSPTVRAQVNSARRGDRRQQQLIDAGFSTARADWIIQREAELRMEAMQARYDAMRSDMPPELMERSFGADNLLREEIGDAEYEMYLEATGRPTTVAVGRVMEASPGFDAGLQAGDQITHYDGVRVFNTVELMQQTMRGNPGENVVVNIIRDGMPMQVVLPRGPIGINTVPNR